MRIFSGSLATETNTFAPLPTGVAGYHERGYFAAGQHPDEMQLFGGPLWAARRRAREHNWDLEEGMVAFAMPGGITTRQAYESLRDELLDDLRRAAPVDIALFGLHGAMVADGYDDCEGDLLRRAREIVGPDVVIGAELDPHCHMTAEMIANTDVLICFKEYPHTDILDRAFELVDLCAAKAVGRINPVASLYDCEMISLLHTTREPGRSFIDRIKSLEGRNGVLSISVVQGFPWGDTPDMGTKILVYTDGDAAGGAALARQLGEELKGMRNALNPPFPAIDDALDQALAFNGGPVVLADSADNAGGGAASDSTFILRRMLERGVSDAVLGPLWDPIAARVAFDAGVGARLMLRIGGKMGPLSGDPVDANCVVKALKRDMIMTGLGGTPAVLGDCALIETGGIDIVLTSIRCQAINIDLFTQLNCDLTRKKIVVVKSSQHFYASYSTVAMHVIYVDAPGAVPADLKTLNYRKIRLPKWPL